MTGMGAGFASWLDAVDARGKSARTVQATGSRWSASLVYVSALYAFVLCLVNTRFVAFTGSAPLVAIEGAVLLVALALLSRRLALGGVMVCLALALNFCVLSIVRDYVDVKALRDLLMLVVFTWLGFAYGSPALAERILRTIACIAVVVGVFELVAPDLYKSVVDAAKFYAARGFATNKYVLQTLLERPSGIGRSILPFLGPRRISSIFLEPVSMGNFAVIIGAWALAKDRVEWRQMLVLLSLSAGVVILADARFGALALILIAVARVCGLWRIRWLHASFPVIGMAVTIAVASFHVEGKTGDDFMGRLLLAGHHLGSLDASAWLGLPQLILLDAGYGYVVQQFGIVMCAVLWAVYCMLPMDARGQRFRFNASLYIALILSVSGSSLFALKTAAILFFLLGSLVVRRRTEARGDEARPPEASEPWPA